MRPLHSSGRLELCAVRSCVITARTHTEGCTTHALAPSIRMHARPPRHVQTVAELLRMLSTTAPPSAIARHTLAMWRDHLVMRCRWQQSQPARRHPCRPHRRASRRLGPHAPARVPPPLTTPIMYARARPLAHRLGPAVDRTRRQPSCTAERFARRIMVRIHDFRTRLLKPF